MTTNKKAEKQRNVLLDAPIPQTLRQITVPMVIGIVTIMTFSLVDTFFVSLLGTKELAAIGFTYPVTFIVMNFIMGLSIGINVVLARLLGQNKSDQAARVATDTVFLAVILMSIVAVIGLMTIDPLFKLLGASDEIVTMIHEYMIPWYIGITLLTIPMVGNGTIRASGDMKTPSYIMITAGVINGILDPLLIFGIGPFPELGLQGAAIATVIAWGCSMVAALWVLIKHKKLLILQIPKITHSFISCKPVVLIAIPTAISNMLIPLATGVVTALVARFGEEAVAGFGVGARLEALSLVIAMALSAALTTFVGQNLGAGNIQRAKESIKISIKFLLIFQLGLYLIYLLFSENIASLFSQETIVQQNIALYLMILPLTYGLQAMTMIIGSFMNTLHKPMRALSINLARLFVFYIPLSYIGAYWGDYKGLLIGGMTSSLFAAIIALILIRIEFKQLSTTGIQNSN